MWRAPAQEANRHSVGSWSPYYMHFSACAVEPTRTIFIYGTRLREKCDANHELGYQLMKRVAEVVVRNLNATQQRLLERTDTSNL
jgi:CRP/FNR family transcriptional regulator, cyclic AMP receptor protein